VKIPSRLFRAAIAIATVAILSVNGTGWAATTDPVEDPGAVPAPYLGGPVVLPVPPPAPTLAAACQPHAQGDYVHATTDVSGHGWWTRGTCPNTKAPVYIFLFEHYSDGSWRLKGGNSGSIWPGGGSGNRVTVRRTCESPAVAGWQSRVEVYIGSGDFIYTPVLNLNCSVFT
jgi:hypothetical protein